MIDRFISNYEVFFDARVAKPSASAASYTNNGYQGVKDGMTRLGESGKDFLFIDKKLFKKELSELVSRYKEIDTLIFFKLIHVAYERVLNNKNKNTIFYHIHNPDSCSKLNFAGLANDTKWLLTVRDPVEGTESWIYQHFMENDYKKVITKIISTLFTIDQPVFNENNSIGVRLDDLKQKPKETIAALCDWMGIKEENTLYEMTAQGKKWWGDHSTPFLPAFGKVDKRKLGKVFSKKDKFILDTLVYPIRVKFNYTEENIEKFRKDLKTIRPMINEIFDFEKEIALKNNIDEKSFMISAFPCIFRTVLLNRWKILDKFNTYPNMLQPLQIL